MADDKDSKQVNAESGRRGRRLLPLLMVAAGAALGGAGVVLLGPQPKIETPKRQAPELVQREHPDAMDFTFNPQVERGQKNAIVKFQFVYQMDARKEQAVLASIEDYWTRAYSRCLLVLKNRPASAFMTHDGITLLTKELADELTASLFPTGIAKVDDILWLKVMVQ
jgi:flagellar basal body-associated protein FliL